MPGAASPCTQMMWWELESFLNVSVMRHNILKIFLVNISWDIFPRVALVFFFFSFGENPGLILLGYKFSTARIFVFFYVSNAPRATVHSVQAK